MHSQPVCRMLGKSGAAGGGETPPPAAREGGESMTEVVAALIWRDRQFLIGQRPAHKCSVS